MRNMKNNLKIKKKKLKQNVKKNIKHLLNKKNSYDLKLLIQCMMKRKNQKF